MKVYVTILWWEENGDRDFSYQIHDTREKAQETLEKWKQEELANSWINTIEDIEDLENYEDELEYFDCDDFDRRTTIWIEEKVVE
jgi:hypothetical protein